MMKLILFALISTFFPGYDAHFYSENNSSFALNQKSHTLVCDKLPEGDIKFHDENGMMTYFDKDCTKLYQREDMKNFDFTCQRNLKAELHIKVITMKEDGKIFLCISGGMNYTLKLAVNFAVTSVSIERKSDVLIENRDGIFVCEVEKSKPKASFQWITLDWDGGERVHEQFNTSGTEKERFWQTESYLVLKLKRVYKQIMCRAKIENMAWTSSKTLPLDIKYPPDGNPSIILPPSGMCLGKKIEIKCEWKGGKPDASLKLACLSKVKEGGNSVWIKNIATQKLYRTCICNGTHPGGNAYTEKELDIHYPPDDVTITQTSYLEGKTASLICEASGGDPEVYNYQWSPNYTKETQIVLNKTINKEKFTCKVFHECSGGNPLSRTIELNVEYYPIIKMNDSMTVIENQMYKISCPVEGNPKPTIKWKFKHKTIRTELLELSFDRHQNGSEIQCIATANSSKDGILERSKKMSILVTYPPDITFNFNVIKLGLKAEISCRASASPNDIDYKIVQKWGQVIKKVYNSGKISLANFSFQNLGNWTCQASNGVPQKDSYTEKSVEIKVDVPARFKGDKNETATVGSTKLLKICFYCYPEATKVKWFKGEKEISPDRISFIPPEEGQFPFPGNCSILKLDIKEKEVQIYYLHVTNPVGKRIFNLTLDSGIPDNSQIHIIIVVCVIVVIIIIAGIVLVKIRRFRKEKQNNNNLVHKSSPADDTETVVNSLYEGNPGVTNHAASNVEPLYAQVNKPPKKLNQVSNASNVEPLYAQVNKPPKKLNQVSNASDVEPFYAQVNKPPKKLNKLNNASIEELYAKVNKAKETQSPDKNVSDVEPLYAQVDKRPKKLNKVNDQDLYANVEPISSPPKAIKKPPLKLPALPSKRKQDAQPAEDIYENLKEKEPVKEDLLYADLEFISNTTEKEKDKSKMKKDEPTIYASIDFQ